MKGRYPIPYFRNPKMEKPIEEIWDDIDAYSGEFFEDEKENMHKIDFIVPLPPLKYEGKLIKGILLTQGAEYILKLHPELKELFFVGAYTMWSSYSWCDKADLYFACYENKPRENYHKKKYQNKKDIIFIPLQDADFTNEYILAPSYNTKKDVDIISVSTPYEVKNHIMIAKTIKAYQKMYGVKLKARFIFGIDGVKKYYDGEIDYSELSPKCNEILDEVNSILDGNMKEYVDVIPRVQHGCLNIEYSRARCLVLASLIEGKNRSLNEAMSCNVPVAVFREHNQWARGEHPIFYGNSGELAEEFTPESMAEAIHKILNTPQNYEPRKNYLKYNGRKNFVNTCAKYIPYYRENVPDYDENMFWNNLWIDMACQANYQMSYLDFLYGKANNLSWIHGIENIDFLTKYYCSMFGVEYTSKRRAHAKTC